MNIYLEDRKKDISAFKKAIKLCKDDVKTVKVLKCYLERIKDEYSYADFLKNSFIPLIQNKDNFYCAFIFFVTGGDYSIEVYIHNGDEKSKKEYIDIYNNYCNENQETFFHFKVYDIKKDKNVYDEASDYDKMVIRANKTPKEIKSTNGC